MALSAAIALTIGCTANASAATIVVNVTNDAPDGSIDDTGCALREAVQSANTNVPGDNCNADTAGADTIVLEAGGPPRSRITRHPRKRTPRVLTNVTINRNSATGPSTNVYSGGILLGGVSGISATIRGSILAGNEAKSQLDCGQQSPSVDLVSLGDNLLGAAATADCVGREVEQRPDAADLLDHR